MDNEEAIKKERSQQSEKSVETMKDGQEKSVNRNRKAAYTNEKMKKKVKKERESMLNSLGQSEGVAQWTYSES